MDIPGYFDRLQDLRFHYFVELLDSLGLDLIVNLLLFSLSEDDWLSWLELRPPLVVWLMAGRRRVDSVREHSERRCRLSGLKLSRLDRHGIVLEDYESVSMVHELFSVVCSFLVDGVGGQSGTDSNRKCWSPIPINQSPKCFYQMGNSRNDASKEMPFMDIYIGSSFLKPRSWCK